MKIIILAAGKGHRLGQNIPKALVKLDKDTTILDSQLSAVNNHFKISDIIIITGYKKSLIENKYPDLNYIENPRYEFTNTSKSLLYATDNICNEDIIYMNGDVVFDPQILELIINNRDNNLICVNNASVSDEEVKYSLDENQAIKHLSKSVTDPLGEAIGINYIKNKDLNIFKDCLRQCADTDYHEKAVEIAIGKGIQFFPLNIESRLCIEVDFEEDLKQAAKIWQSLSNEQH